MDWKRKIKDEIQHGSCLTIGNFDGVHLGHQRLIQEVLLSARQEKRIPLCLTFTPHPQNFLTPEKPVLQIMNSVQKKKVLLSYGLKEVCEEAFNADFASLEPSDFVNLFLEQIFSVKTLVIGQDFRFGKKGQGDVAFLQRWGEQKDIQIVSLPKVRWKGEDVSSSRIRTCILNGDFEEANEMLGRKFSVVGRVVQGDQRGRKIGFPTANFSFFENQLLPSNGVYVGWVQWEEKSFRAVANIGERPTFDGKERKMEVHVLDFHQEIYGEEMEFFFASKIREEKKFESIQDLVFQIQQDVVQARTFPFSKQN